MGPVNTERVGPDEAGYSGERERTRRRTKPQRGATKGASITAAPDARFFARSNASKSRGFRVVAGSGQRVCLNGTGVRFDLTRAERRFAKGEAPERTKTLDVAAGEVRAPADVRTEQTAEGSTKTRGRNGARVGSFAVSRLSSRVPRRGNETLAGGARGLKIRPGREVARRSFEEETQGHRGRSSSRRASTRRRPWCRLADHWAVQWRTRCAARAPTA